MTAEANRRRHLVPLLVVQAVGLACGMVGVHWSSQLVPPAVLGTFGLLLSTQALGTSVTHQGLIMHVQRHWTVDLPATAMLRAWRGSLLGPAAWLGGGLALAATALHLGSGLGLGWWPWMVGVNAAFVVATLVHAALQAEQRYWAHCAVSAVCSLTRTFLPLAFAACGAATLAWLAGGYLVHAALWAAAGCWAWRGAWRRATIEVEVDSPRELIRAFAGIGLASWLAAASPRWFAAAALPPETVGHFILAGNLALIVPAAASLILQGYSFPALFAAERAGQPVDELFRRSDRMALGATGLAQAGLVALALVAPWLVGWLIDPRYAAAVDWILAAGGASAACISAGFYCNVLVARRQSRDCLTLTAASAALRIALMATAAWSAPVEWFRWALILSPWPTLLLERSLARRALRRAVVA